MNKTKSFVILFVSLLLNQTWQPFHIEDLNKNRNVIINYHATDQIAINQDVNNVREDLSHEVIGYLPYWQYNNYPNFNFNLLTQLNYFSAELDQYGNIINNHNWNNLYIVEYAHQRGVKVSLCATLFGQSQLETLLSNSSYRQNAINNLLELVVNKNADGIDIDFELVPNSQRENLVIFMEELSNTFHEHMSDPLITMATPPIDWSNAWDYNSLAQICDRLFIMGYNYFYSGSPNAGPVSPLGGYYYDLEFSINDYIDKTNGQTDKIILGLPYYGYDWPVEDNLINSETIGVGEARTFQIASMMSQEYGNNWNNTSNSSWFTYQDNNWNQCWYDDSLSLSIKYQFAIDNQLSGIGIWALGYDNGFDELWGALSDKFLSFLLGDVNYDNNINVLDVIALVNIILETNSYQLNADINSDQLLNVIDLIELVNIIINI